MRYARNAPDAERKLRRADCKERAVAEDYANPGDRDPRKRAPLGRLKEALLDPGYVITRHIPAHYNDLERRVRARFAISPIGSMCLITRAYRPSSPVRVRKLRSFGNRSAECNLRTAGRAGNATLALHSLDVNLAVELAHSRDDCLKKFRKYHHALRMRKRVPPCFRGRCGPGGVELSNHLSAREKLGVSFPTGLMASEMTGSGRNIEVCG